jgi:hypothetical protein
VVKIKITKVWNTGERVEQEIDVPEGKEISSYIRNAFSQDGIWTEPDGRELENLENVEVYDRRVQGLIWRDEDTFDSLTITW